MHRPLRTRLRAPRRLALLLGVLAACQPAAAPEAPAAGELGAGRAFELQLAARIEAAGPELASADAISAGYLARLRLGLGSPFRLVEHALLDGRLSVQARRATAWALLAATADGRAYRVEPAALAAEGGGAHLEAIAAIIDEAADPHAGAMAVRLAFRLLEAEGTVPAATRRGANRAATLLRDRALARADLARMLEEAEAADADPLAVLPRWRRERRFRVERPLTGAEALARENAAMRLTPAAMERLRAAAAVEPVPAEPPAPLSAAAALRLLALADSLNPPPRSALATPLRQLRSEVATRPGLTAAERRRLDRFAAVARDEERFAADYFLARRQVVGPAGARLLAAMAMDASLSMGMQGQERVWHPGTPGPAEVDLQWRYGLAAVGFSSRVPQAWRPYLLFALDGALADWTEVFPAATLQGLRIWFGDEGVPDHALAIHSPRTGTIRLPPTTGLGNVAHEIAHEMDRAESARRYGSPRRYATDDVLQRGRRDAFAAASRAFLQGAAVDDSPEGEYLNRPAEIFARKVDWYLSSALAERGRQNGDLSMLRDGQLSGGGSDPVPAADSGSRALAKTLQLMMPLPEEDLRRFTARFGPTLAPRPGHLAESVAEAGRLVGGPAPRDSAARERWLATARTELRRVRESAAQARAEHARCGTRLVLSEGTAPAADARLALIAAAEEAGLRRVTGHYAERLAGAAGRAWVRGEDEFAPGRATVPAELATWLRRLVTPDAGGGESLSERLAACGAFAIG